MVCVPYVEYICTYYLKKNRRTLTYASGVVITLFIAYMCMKSLRCWSKGRLSEHNNVSYTRPGNNWRMSDFVNSPRNGDNNKLYLTNERYFKPRPREVNPHNYKFLLKNEKLCSGFTPFLFIVVPSVYHHADIRNAIRQTWASVASSQSHRNTLPVIKLLFLFGTIPTIKSNHILNRELEKYGDIVQVDFLDIYFNLTIKILAALRWVALYCPAVKFILKADEDVFVNVPLLVETLGKVDNPDSIIGHVEQNSKVARYGKWSVLKSVYPFDVYPDYTQGNAYIIPGHLAFVMFNTSRFLPYLPIEDVFITGVLGRAIGAKLSDDPRFTFLIDTPPSACGLAKGEAISITNVRINDFYELWDKLKSNVSLCKTP